MTEDEIRAMQELYTKELGENIIKKLKTEKKSFRNLEIEKNKVLMDKMVDDFNVSALKNTIFSQQAEEKRDIDTFLDRIYFDNFGNYEIFNEQTYEELQFDDTQFNSFTQLINGLQGTRGTPAHYIKILQKLIMIVEIWQKNKIRGMIEITLPEKKIRVRVKDVMKKLIYDQHFLDEMFLYNSTHGFITGSLSIPIFELTSLLFRMNFEQEAGIIKMNMMQKGWLDEYEKLITENSAMEVLYKDGILTGMIKIFEVR